MLTVFKRYPKFSEENLQYQCGLLEKNININAQNEQLVISSLQQISELMIWGDQNDETFFDIIAENNIFEKFQTIIKQQYNKFVTTQVLQTLSIIIENISNTTSLYMLFSNNYINDLIIYPFNFNDSDILGYYIILLRQISSKLDENIINFFFNSKTNDFPLYVSALKFFSNENQTVRTKVMQIILNIFKVCTKCNELKQFILYQSALSYFLNLILFIKNDCIQLNKMITSRMSNLGNKVRAHIDYYYYLQDILSFNIDLLSHKLINQLFAHLILPVFVASLSDNDDDDDNDEKCDNQHNKIGKQLAIFLLTQMLIIFSDKQLKHAIIVSVIYPHPPKLINEIILSPPKYAIETKIPIHYLLSFTKIKNNSIRNGSLSQSQSQSHSMENRSETMKNVLNNDENDKIKRSEIISIRKIDIIHDESVLPREENDYNILNILFTNPNEQLIACIASFIFIVIRDKSLAIIIKKELFSSTLIIITCIINILRKNYSILKVFTMRILIELLIDFVDNINDKNKESLQKIWQCITNDLSQYCMKFVCNDESMKTYLLDTFEQEWMVQQQGKETQIASLISNPNRILVYGDVYDEEKKEMMMNNYTQQLRNKLDVIRESIKHFLYFSPVKRQLLCAQVNLPFIARRDWKYYNRLQVPLLRLASGCLNTLVLYDNNDNNNNNASHVRERVLFSTREANWLLLFNRISNSKGFCVIYLAVPIHNVECVMDKYDPRIIRLTIKSSLCPHEKIAKAITKSNKNHKWIITLFFDSMFDEKEKNKNNKHALIAMEYITMNRMRVRRKMMQNIERLINNDMFDDNDVIYNV